jgi:hypothetical protein
MYDPVTLTVLQFGFGGILSVIGGGIVFLSFITEQHLGEKMFLL